MKFTKIALTLLCSTLLFCGCAKNSDVVLKVNDEAITRGEFYADFNKIKNVQFRNTPKEYQKDNSYPVLILKDRYVNDIIVRKLLAQEMEKRKIDATPEEIEAKKKTTIAQVGSEEQLKQILKENNISDKQFNDDMASEVKIGKLVDILDKSKISAKDAENFYKKNKEQFNLPERAQVSHILIDTNPENIRRIITDADKDGKLTAAEIDKKVQAEVKRKEALAAEVRTKAAQNTAKFAELAKQYSEDKASAEHGGDLGYIQKGQMVPEFEHAAFTQKVGVVGGIVKSQYGSHIILVKDKNAAGLQPFSQVKEDLIKYLTMQKKGETLRNYIENLKNNAKIEFVDPDLNPENIKKQADEAIKKQLEKEQKEQQKIQAKEQKKAQTKEQQN